MNEITNKVYDVYQCRVYDKKLLSHMDDDVVFLDAEIARKRQERLEEIYGKSRVFLFNYRTGPGLVSLFGHN